MPSGTVTRLLYGNAFFLTIQHRIGYNAPKLRVSILAHDANRIQPWMMAKKHSVTVITVNIQLYTATSIPGINTGLSDLTSSTKQEVCTASECVSIQAIVDEGYAEVRKSSGQ
jgi:hypothetical protein